MHGAAFFEFRTGQGGTKEKKSGWVGAKEKKFGVGQGRAGSSV